VERLFDQPGLSRVATLENMLSSDQIIEDKQEVFAIYDEVDAILEHRMLPSLFPASQTSQFQNGGNAEQAQAAVILAPHCMPKNVYEWADYFAAQPSALQ